jgi:hypothetical protein
MGLEGTGNMHRNKAKRVSVFLIKHQRLSGDFGNIHDRYRYPSSQQLVKSPKWI